MALQILAFKGALTADKSHSGQFFQVPLGPPIDVSAAITNGNYSVPNDCSLIQIKGSGSITWTLGGTAENFSASDVPTMRGVMPGATFQIGTGSGTTAPAQVGTVTPTPGVGQVALAWAAPANGGSAITDYVIEYKLSSGSSWSTFADGVSATTGATVTGLTGNSSYDFRVSAVNGIGPGAPSAVVSATPSAAATAPGQVGTVTPTSGNAQVALAWTAPAANGAPISDYIVEYKLSTGSSWTNFADGVSPTTGAVVSGLTNGSAYDFRVSAVNSNGPGPSSSVVSATPASVPAQVTGLGATPGNGQVALAWTAPAANGAPISDYIVEYKLSTASSWTTFPDGTSAAAGATVTGLTNNSFYDFRVSAVNAVGPGPVSSTASATPAPASASAFTMSQLAMANRIYQRDTLTGGGQSKGRGTIPVPLSAVTATGPVYARIRSDDGTTILQASYQAATLTATGAQTVPITNVDARLGWFYVDLSVDGTTWQNGTVLVGMGALTLGSGQSMMARFLQETVDTTTIAAAGVTVPANGRVFASIDSTSAAPATWVQPTDGQTINGAGVAEYLRLMIAALGVNVGFVSKCLGSTTIEQWQIGQTLGDGLINTMAAAGGKFERVIWWQGHSNAVNNTTEESYKASLSTWWTGVNANNSFVGVTRYVASIPNITNGWGSIPAKEAIRRASYEGAIANGAVPVLMNDAEMNPDGVHAMQVGSKRFARHHYRAQRPSMSLAHNDNGAVLGAPTHAVGSPNIVIPFTLPAGATGLSAVGSPETRIKVYKGNDRFTPLAYAGTTPFAIDNTGKTITLTLAADPGQINLDVLPFGTYDPVVDGSASMVYDDLVDTDGLTQGRHIFPGVNPLTIRVSSDLTLTSPVYGTGYFGQTMTSGKGLSSHIVPDPSRGFTLEAWLRVDTVNSSTHIFMGSDKCIWIACANNDLKVQIGTAAQGSYAGVLPTGTWVHVAVVVPPLATSATVYVNGVAQGATTAVANLQQASPFGVRCGGGFAAAFDLTTFGSEDEVALFEGARYSANFTPPTGPYTGNESKLIGLWHLNGDGVNSKVAA